MDKLIKFFPFLPEKNDGSKLAIAIVFYAALLLFGIPIGIIILGLTFIFALLVPIFILVATAYSIMGIVFAIMSYNGYDFSAKTSGETTVTNETVTVSADISGSTTPDSTEE